MILQYLINNKKISYNIIYIKKKKKLSKFNFIICI